MVTVTQVSDGSYCVWKKEDVLLLRNQHRIVGKSIGTWYKDPQQNAVLGPPAILSVYQLLLLLDLKIVPFVGIHTPVDQCSAQRIINSGPVLPKKFTQRITRDEDKTAEMLQTAQKGFNDFVAGLDPRDWAKYKIYKHFYNLGYTVCTGINYGADFTCYAGDPSVYHAMFVVSCVDYTESLPVLLLVKYTRLSSTIRKTFVLAAYHSDTDTTSTLSLTRERLNV